MKSYELRSTKHPRLYRIVDREGNWEHYAFIKSWAPGYDPKEAPRFEDIKEAAYLRGATTILGLGYAKDPFFLNWLSTHTLEERNAILTAAGDRGDMVHRWIDMVLTFGFADGKATTVEQGWERDFEIHNRETGEERALSNDEWDAVLAWAAFWGAHAPLVVISEAPIYNLTLGYAGTADALLVLTKACGGRTCPCASLLGKVGLWDWKTSSGIYPSYSAQVAAYTKGDNTPEYLPKGSAVDYTAVIRLGTRHKNGGYEIEASIGPEVDADMERFTAAKRIADHGYKPFDPAKDVVEVPDKINLTVTKFVPPKVAKAPKTPKQKKANSKEQPNKVLPLLPFLAGPEVDGPAAQGNQPPIKKRVSKKK